MGSLCLVCTLFTIVSTRVLYCSHGLSLPCLHSLYHCKYQSTLLQSWALSASSLLSLPLKVPEYFIAVMGSLCLVCTLFTIVSTRVLYCSHGLSLPCLHSLYHCKYQSTSLQSWALSALSALSLPL